MLTVCSSFRKYLQTNLKKLAEEEANSLYYWFRQKYNLSPKDPRFLSCEDWEIELEYEIDRYLKEYAEMMKRRCPKCGLVTYSDKCISCNTLVPKEAYYDPDYDDYEKKVIEENEEFFKQLQWTEVKDEEIEEVLKDGVI